MGFFDVLRDVFYGLIAQEQQNQQRFYKQLERYEQRLSKKSNSELKAIVYDDYKSQIERDVAKKIYKDRH